GMQALRLYYESKESQEGVQALNEKRKPDFRKFSPW
ncbi:1,4-dihydroxy-2-naphthoyl-CoA synthase, partial [Myxococcota bacterium]|nr:1,4-dihydroxy-2-naphthoyl-CoA synthase [Myxococcota bacterium]